MSLLELIGLFFSLFWLIYILLWFVLDCNVRLWLQERFGDPVSKLRHKVVWITGASSGIGRALAIRLAKDGVCLVLSARREEQLQEVRKACLVAGAGKLLERDVLVLPMDMLQLQTHEYCLQQVIKHFGELDVVVNNAGRSQRATWEDIDVEVDRQLFELDVFAVLHLSRLVVRYYKAECAGYGQLAATSSVAGIGAVPFSASYCGAKHALNAYFAALRMEHPKIGVTVFAPGPVATDFLREAFTDSPNAKVNKEHESVKDRMTAERCAELYAVALANKNPLSWCGKFPVVFLAYTMQYPTVQRWIWNLVGQKRLAKIRDGK